MATKVETFLKELQREARTQSYNFKTYNYNGSAVVGWRGF
jgi:hypothetical protein